MNPLTMKDENIMVEYNHPAYNVVLTELTKDHMATINAKYLDGYSIDSHAINLATYEAANCGRRFMLMDGQDPEVICLYRSATKTNTPLHWRAFTYLTQSFPPNQCFSLFPRHR
mmetsp:Transcript_17248/g.25974  ORF Transcript_17248/g.25974 Transcript_17248/m.25974 type:complete len:114 (+) Transcript_17248:232-573(+)